MVTMCNNSMPLGLAFLKRRESVDKRCRLRILSETFKLIALIAWDQVKPRPIAFARSVVHADADQTATYRTQICYTERVQSALTA